MAAKRKRVDMDLSAKMKISEQVNYIVKRKGIAYKCGIDVSNAWKLVTNVDRMTCTRSLLWYIAREPT
jgi:hypothetical protein